MAIRRLFNPVNIRKKTLIYFVIAAPILIFIHLKLVNYAFDDAYIHFRIARNFVETGYPYYNIGEPVMASSSSLWTIFLALIFVIFPKNPVLAISSVNAVVSIFGSILAKKIYSKLQVKKTTFSESYIISILYISLILIPSTGLMETSVAMFLFLLTVYLFVNNKKSSYFLLGVLPFIRVEFGFFCIIIIIYLWITKKITFQGTFFTAIGAAPFLFYEIIYFKTIIPNTIYAKAAAYELTNIESILSVISTIYPIDKIFNPSVYIMSFFLMLFILLIIYCLRDNQKNLDWEFIFLFFSLSVSFFYGLGKTIIFPWYAPFISVPLFIALLSLIIKQRIRFSPLLISIMIFPWFYLLLQTFYSATIDISYYQEALGGARVRKYIEVGQRLNVLFPSSTLMTSEIGGLGWGFTGHIIDGLGLVTPEAISYNKGEYGAIGIIPYKMIQRMEPEIIVSHPIFLIDVPEAYLLKDYNLIVEDVFLEEDYRLLTKKNLWGTDKINIYIKNTP